jgi:hypothetical protein
MKAGGGDVYNWRGNTLRGYKRFIGKKDGKYRSSISFGFVDTAGTTNKEEGLLFRDGFLHLWFWTESSTLILATDDGTGKHSTHTCD